MVLYMLVACAVALVYVISIVLLYDMWCAAGVGYGVDVVV